MRLITPSTTGAWGLGHHGKVLGNNYKHEFMGPLTAALTLVNLNENQLQLTVNLRVPKGKTSDQLKISKEDQSSSTTKNTQLIFITKTSSLRNSTKEIVLVTTRKELLTFQIISILKEISLVEFLVHFLLVKKMLTLAK